MTETVIYYAQKGMAVPAANVIMEMRGGDISTNENTDDRDAAALRQH